MHIETSRPSER